MRRKQLAVWGLVILGGTIAAITSCKTTEQDSLVKDAIDGGAPLAEKYWAGFNYGNENLSPAAIEGRKIWYYATAGNDKYHSYFKR